MGILYTVCLVDDAARAWLLEQDITCSERSSRWPTGEELRQAVECFSGVQGQYNDNGLGHCFQALLNWGDVDEQGIWAALNVEQYRGSDQGTEFWFEKGTAELNVAITLALSAKTGPLVLFADCGGHPLVLDYPNTTQEAIDEWVDVSKSLWVKLFGEVQSSSLCFGTP